MNTAIVLINILVFLILSILGDPQDPSFMAGHGGLVNHSIRRAVYNPDFSIKIVR